VAVGVVGVGIVVVVTGVGDGVCAVVVTGRLGVLPTGEGGPGRTSR
jgi:hypothetical protein